MTRCNKCGQDSPHLSDSWCLACSGAEALVGELKLCWGNPGSRALATDLVVACVRQVRAARRLGIAGAGKIRASSPPLAGTSRASGTAAAEDPPAEPKPAEEAKVAAAVPKPPSPPPREEAPAPEAAVKAEREESSEYTEGSETEGEPDKTDKGAETEDHAKTHGGLKPVPKSRAGERSADDREEIPRRRTHERTDREREADPREDHRDRRDQYWSPRRYERRSRSRRDRGRDYHRPEHRPEGQKRQRKRKKHRGGTRHQQIQRAATDPFRRFHQRKPDTFWDQAPTL
eukprot:s823_g7.t1